MLRNKGIKSFLFSMLSLTIVGGVILIWLDPLTGSLALIWMCLLVGISIFYSYRRYDHIRKLSGYLRKISNGQYSLDIRDNQEGELSILKNEMYKVTLMLSKQSDDLSEDKKHLADALSDISHQLKTPLTSMLVMVDLLNENEQDLSPAKRMEFTGNIEKQLNRMDWLLNSLLKLSKIDAGTAIFKREPVMVTELLEHSLAPLLIPIELKNQELKISGNNTVRFKGDLQWTSEALINILKNCVEHTPEGGEISIHYEDNPLYTEIVIEDNGKGISKEDLPNVFKRFYRGKNASDGSVGIGLAMANSIITSQQGSLSVKSKVDEGTQFNIKFHKSESD